MPNPGSSGRPKEKKDNNLAQVSLLAAIPGMLIAGPLIGLFAGRWGDEQLGWTPWLTIIGTVFGLAAAGRQVWELVKRSEKIEKEAEQERKL